MMNKTENSNKLEKLMVGSRLIFEGCINVTAYSLASIVSSPFGKYDYIEKNIDFYSENIDHGLKLLKNSN